jgi:hypothetical protein
MYMIFSHEFMVFKWIIICLSQENIFPISLWCFLFFSVSFVICTLYKIMYNLHNFIMTFVMCSCNVHWSHLPPYYILLLPSNFQVFSFFFLNSSPSLWWLFIRLHMGYETCKTCHSESGLFQLIWSPVRSIFIQMAWSCFLWLNNPPLYSFQCFVVYIMVVFHIFRLVYFQVFYF